MASNQKMALVTGASTGIGYELSKVLAKEGFGLILVARSHEKLAQVAEELRRDFHIPVSVIPLDLGAPGAAEALYREVRQLGNPVEVLVNNAGIGLWGPFAEADIATSMQMVQLNIVSLTHLTKLFVDEMVKRGSGRILNVASTAAFQPGPLMAIYYASKAYVLHFSEALGDELRGKGITVTALCPGATESNFSKTAGMEKSKLFQRRIMDAPTVARAGYRAMMRGKAVVIPGALNRLLALSVRFAPRSWVTVLSRKVVESV